MSRENLWRLAGCRAGPDAVVDREAGDVPPGHDLADQGRAGQRIGGATAERTPSSGRAACVLIMLGHHRVWDYPWPVFERAVKTAAVPLSHSQADVRGGGTPAASAGES